MSWRSRKAGGAGSSLWERKMGLPSFRPARCPELRLEDVDEGCCALPAMWQSAAPYGQSFESLKTEHILGLFPSPSRHGKELKANGSGKLPPTSKRGKQST